MKIEIPDIEGYELAEGKQPRTPKKGDDFTSIKGSLYHCEHNEMVDPYIILKKKAAVYKIITAASFLQESGHIDLRKKFVEIKAIEDALNIIEDLANTEDDRVVMRNLQELLK